MQAEEITIGMPVYAVTAEHPTGLYTQVISGPRSHPTLGTVVTCAMIGDPVPIINLSNKATNDTKIL